jgi:hypothetical protein
MAVVGVRSGVGRRGSSLERCGRSLAAQRLVVGATGIGRDVRSSYNARGRLLGEASRRCFYFLHVDVPSAGSLKPQTESMQAGYGWWCLVLGALVWYGMFRRALLRLPNHTLDWQLAAAGRPFCVSRTDILGHRTGGSRDWGRGGTRSLQCRNWGKGDMRLQERRLLLLMEEEDAQIRTRPTTTRTRTTARARTG